jgi:hypothetical protein
MRKIILSGLKRLFKKEERTTTCPKCSIPAKYRGFKRCPMCGARLVIYKGE